MKILLVTFPDLSTEIIESSNFDNYLEVYEPIIKGDIEYHPRFISKSGKEAICTGYSVGEKHETIN